MLASSLIAKPYYIDDGLEWDYILLIKLGQTPKLETASVKYMKLFWWLITWFTVSYK